MSNLTLLSMQVEEEEAQAVKTAVELTQPTLMTPREILRYQETSQYPLSLDDDESNYIKDVVNRRDATFDNIGRQTESVIALESMCAYLKRCNSQGLLNKPAVTMATLAMEGYYDKANVDKKNLRLAYESDVSGEHPELNASLESIAQSVRVIHDSIKNNLIKVSRFVSEIFSSFNRHIASLKKRVQQLSAELDKKHDAQSKFPAVKAEKWCINLCYTETGFDVGLKNVLTDVNAFVKDHTHVAEGVINKYITWLKNNDTSEAGDVIFEGLSTKRHDFLIPGMSEFNRSVSFTTPAGDNIFYRSKELPGGKALYVQTYPHDMKGLASLDILNTTEYKMDLYNPNSYNTTKMKIAAIAALPVAAWVAAVNPIIGVALGAAAGSYITSQKQDGTGKEVHIDKDMLFQALTKDEMADVLKRVYQGINELENWSIKVLQGPWKSHKLDKAVDELMRNESVTSNYRSYCNALLKLVSNLSSDIDSYVFSVYTSSLLYVEKSLKQYS